jgi:hypothetical protein
VRWGRAGRVPAPPRQCACARIDTMMERARADPRSQTEESGCAERWEDSEQAARPACALVGAACVCGCGLRAAVPMSLRAVRLSVSFSTAQLWSGTPRAESWLSFAAVGRFRAAMSREASKIFVSRKQRRSLLLRPQSSTGEILDARAARALRSMLPRVPSRRCCLLSLPASMEGCGAMTCCCATAHQLHLSRAPGEMHHEMHVGTKYDRIPVLVSCLWEQDYPSR